MASMCPPAVTAYSYTFEPVSQNHALEAVFAPLPSITTTPVPTLSQWALALLALLVVGGAALKTRGMRRGA